MLALRVFNELLKGKDFVAMAIGIGGNCCPAGPTEEFVYRLIVHLPVEIPQGCFDAGDSTRKMKPGLQVGKAVYGVMTKRGDLQRVGSC